MFGILGALLFGGVAYGAWAKDCAVESGHREYARAHGDKTYVDRKGRIRDVGSGRIVAGGIDDWRIQTIVRIQNEDKKAYEELCQRQGIHLDPTYYTFQDYVYDKYRKCPDFGKHNHPRYDWDNIPPRKRYKEWREEEDSHNSYMYERDESSPTGYRFKEKYKDREKWLLANDPDYPRRRAESIEKENRRRERLRKIKEEEEHRKYILETYTDDFYFE